MTRSAPNTRIVALAVTTALASSALAGCATQSAPRADLSASQAQTALAKGQTSKAVELAEAAVLAEPRNASYRAMLGATYMEAGRFQSAATSFSDAMALGDTSPRTALSLALAQSASGDNRSAHALLTDYRDDLDAADLGLAMALAGDPNQGVHVLSNAIRGGENTAKTRQNLAYAYALQGNWRAARLMAAEDVPADKIDARISQWARTAAPELVQQRVAALLEVPVVGDTGQPAQLALANNPSNQQMAAEAATMIPAPEAAPAFAVSDSGELPALATFQAPAQVAAAETPIYEPAAETPPASFRQAFATTVAEPARADGVTTAAKPARAPAVAAPRLAVSAPGGDHMVQLGSFSSKDYAQRAIGIYAKRYANLSRYDMVINEARVNGKTYWRVAAGGMARSDARSACTSVKARGFGCIAYAAANPLPGSVNTGVRMASR